MMRMDEPETRMKEIYTRWRNAPYQFAITGSLQQFIKTTGETMESIIIGPLSIMEDHLQRIPPLDRKRTTSQLSRDQMKDRLYVLEALTEQQEIALRKARLDIPYAELMACVTMAKNYVILSKRTVKSKTAPSPDDMNGRKQGHEEDEISADQFLLSVPSRWASENVVEQILIDSARAIFTVCKPEVRQPIWYQDDDEIEPNNEGDFTKSERQAYQPLKDDFSNIQLGLNERKKQLKVAQRTPRGARILELTDHAINPTLK